MFNSLWPSDVFRCHRTWSTLVQVMAWCLMAQSHYLNQCWLIISEILWHSSKGNFTGNAQNIVLHEFEIMASFSKEQHVNPLLTELFWKDITYIFIVYHLLILTWHRYLKTFPMDNDLSGQGARASVFICTLLLMEYSSYSTRRVKFLLWWQCHQHNKLSVLSITSPYLTTYNATIDPKMSQ